jgi:hypothetical protein
MAKKQVWQKHHITYEPEYTVTVTRGEHYVITQLQRFGSLSAGAAEALLFIVNNKPRREKPACK